MFLQVGVIILQIQVANNLYHPRGPLNLFFFTRSHSRPPLRRPKNPSSLYSRPVPSPPTSYYFWSTGLIESCRSDGMSFLRLSHKTQYDFCLSLSLSDHSLCGSQLPRHEDPLAILWRGLHDSELRPPASSHVSEHLGGRTSSLSLWVTADCKPIASPAGLEPELPNYPTKLLWDP